MIPGYYPSGEYDGDIAAAVVTVANVVAALVGCVALGFGLSDSIWAFGTTVSGLVGTFAGYKRLRGDKRTRVNVAVGLATVGTFMSVVLWAS